MLAKKNPKVSVAAENSPEKNPRWPDHEPPKASYFSSEPHAIQICRSVVWDLAWKELLRWIMLHNLLQSLAAATWRPLPSSVSIPICKHVYILREEG